MVAFATLKADGMIDDGKKVSFLTLSGKKFGGIYETAGLVTRTPTAEFPDKMAVAGEKVLEAEYIISFTP